MAGRLCFLACENFQTEVQAVIEPDKYEDVALAVFPADCDRPGTVPVIMSILQDCKRQYDRVYLLGGCCTAGLKEKWGEPGVYPSFLPEQCFYHLQGKTLVDLYLGRGCHLVTPGWVGRWRQYADAWGFEPETAREFFRETASRITMLDTGVSATAEEDLREFAAFAGLPCEAAPVGLDFLRSLLRQAVLEWHLDGAKAGLIPSGAPRTADYAMALDLAGALTRPVVEREAVENIFDMFASLFAPQTMSYLHMNDGTPGEIYTRSKAPLDRAATRERLSRFTADSAWTESGAGFVIRIGGQSRTLGVIEIDGVSFPEHRERYLNLALALNHVCNMAIQNARTYESLEEAKRQVQEAKDRLQTYADSVQGLNEELNHHAAELEASNRELETFAYSVSHDLRAPLRSMEGYSSMLLEDYGDRLDEEAKKYLGYIKESSDLMGQLIDDLLKLSQVTRSDMSYEMVDMSELAKKIVAELEKTEPERKVEVTIAAGLTVCGDFNLLRVALENLLGNAWKFTGKTASPRIEVGSADRNGKQCYFVRDNGVGFNMAYADKLFKPFQRLHKASEFSGTGIGLATVQRIIRRHGGEVWAESKAGGGAVFYFTLG
ncbi:MAG: DUF1638 domain-containing protein [Chloroflexi bacterium]|nr:DUF1638 domain-containing protein [Chloroflexota bacterium]